MSTSVTEIVDIKNLSLIFPLRFQHATSIRDVFVQAAKNPFRVLLKAPQSLEVIRNLNLTVNKGDRLALIGVNGAGKTTLCRALAGIYTPTKGKLTVHGRTRAIFDTAIGIYPELTGRENARILTDFLYPDLANSEERIRESLEFTELGHFLDTPFKFYSNGMQARLCLSILTMEPTDLLILDEVFEGADQFFREKISKRVVDIIERSGAVIFVSHNEAQLEKVCNRGVIIADGMVAYDGSVTEALRIYRENHDPRKKVAGVM
ncbi:MAG: ATP-binding cassette domain-containing protein [Bdellovibrionota bacterium]